MTRKRMPARKRNRIFEGRKMEFDFVPNKYQVIHGALLDSGRTTSENNSLTIARSIATLYNEDI